MILNSARDVQNSLVAAGADAAGQIKSISSDVERSLYTVTASTTDNIQTSALNAQNALVAASNEVSARVKTTASEIERTVISAGSSFGSAISIKTDEIVTYVQQQTERLSQMIDGKRGQLVEAIGSKTGQLTVDIDRVTSDALKSIETRSQAFASSIAGNGSEVARTITSAGEIATNAVSKSLKDMEQSSRAAIEQSRQVSIAAVTEMQETSKILRTDTVALFERLREGNILLQEVLTGAHDNLNSLERALVTRVADFVSAMNDVTSRNGTATQTLEDQLSIFNSKTSRALEDLGSLSSQFDTHGRALADAAAMVEQSNRDASISISERKATLEIADHDHRPADRRSRSKAVALHQPVGRIAGGSGRARARYRPRRGRNCRRRLCRDQPPVRGDPVQCRGRAAGDRRVHARNLSADHAGSGHDVPAVRREVRHAGLEHQADGRGNAQRTRSPPATSCAAACSKCRRRPPKAPRRCAR